ncbi:DUF4426 domain-containing protein [Luteimonas sp. RC10]|uniref:DUF4426 domain-containing protein n=1 Tax=Luteimonas sp. RC10 TaxID=2587035 RepID=UPI001612BC9F|nr:DUF4426 domain-containing protein [Luteimonas sp. RC10]MBB3344983.1 hypothetical protein [Luteimonas sp. RC10]
MTERRLPLAAMLALALVACGSEPPPPVVSGVGNTLAMPERAMLGTAQVEASVVPTARISEAAARQYGVDRGADRVLVLVSVRDGDATPPVTVTGHARDLRGVRQSLAFAAVTVDRQVEHIAIARASGPDTLRLEIAVAGADGVRTVLRFSREIPR